MNNFEKYKETIKTIAFGLIEGKPILCDDVKCKNCDFYGTICANERMEWFKAEYEEPKINLPKNLPVDAKIEVSRDGETWAHRHFARFKDDHVETWEAGRTSWTTREIYYSWEYARLPKEE